MEHPLITLDDASPAPGRIRRSAIHSRRFTIAGGLALAEVIAYVATDPSRWRAIVLVGAVLAACIALSGRLAPGRARNMVQIVGIAQGMVIALPLLLGFVQLVFAAVLVIVLIVLFIAIGLRFRR